MFPRQSPTTHTEQLGDEVAVYDRAYTQVHALNPTAARVWQLCDGTTSPEAMAAALRSELALPELEAEAVVTLTLRDLARAHLLEVEGGLATDRRGLTRRALLRRGVAASLLPVIHSIVAPSSVDAQSLPPPSAPTLTSMSPNEGTPDTTVLVTLTGTGFGTTVAVSGTGVTPSNIDELSSTSLEVTFTIAANATPGPRNVTVTTPGGTSNALTFDVNAPPPPSGSQTFTFSVKPQLFTVPAGVTAITIEATGARGGAGEGSLALRGTGGLGGRTTATLSVTPSASLTVRVGGVGPDGSAESATDGGFNGGGGSEGDGGGGGGASDVYDGTTPLVIAGGGGGGGAESGGGATIGGGDGGDGGGLTADPGESPSMSGGGGGGGTEDAGGAGGTVSPGSSTGTPGENGVEGEGGSGGTHQPGIIGGGGGGGGHFGGGGGGGGNPSDAGAAGGGGGSSFAASGATDVEHEQGVNNGAGSVTISW